MLSASALRLPAGALTDTESSELMKSSGSCLVRADLRGPVAALVARFGGMLVFLEIRDSVIACVNVTVVFRLCLQ